MKLRQGKDGQKEAPESGVKAAHISRLPGAPYFRVLGGVCVGPLAEKQADKRILWQADWGQVS